MEKAYITMIMVMFPLEIGNLECNTDKENFMVKMEIFIEDILNKIQNTVKVSIIIMMVNYIKVRLRIIICMG